MKVSVLICAHSQDENYDKLLCRALESLAIQSYDDFETVLVLDECWDGTRSAVKPYEYVLNMRIYDRPHKQGLAIAKNFGLERCNGEWIAFLDADDRYMSCKLEVQMNFLEHNPHVSVCGTLAWDWYNEFDMKPSCFQPGQYQTHDQVMQRLPSENVMCHGSIMVKHDALKAVGNYPTDKIYLGREDWELWQRMANAGFVFHNIPERLYIYSMGTSVER
jgi:glycosyltransferase involved in cell wall biosynthesis